MGDIEFEQFDSKLHYLRTRNTEKLEKHWLRRFCLRPSCIPISVIIILIVLVILLPQIRDRGDMKLLGAECDAPCVVTLTESIPEGVHYPNPGDTPHPSVYTSWMKLMDLAEHSIEIASSYWSLRGTDVSNKTKFSSAWQGEEIFERLERLGLTKTVKLRIVQSQPTHSQPDLDTEMLLPSGAAEVRNLNMKKFLGSGILHTKMWLVDRKHFYVGSANLDWRSLTQVKEMGIVVYNCSCLAQDMAKIFDVYWLLAQENATLPDKWPDALNTRFNDTSPMEVTFNNSNVSTFLASSPKPLCPTGRTDDLTSILHLLERAKKFIYIAVMDYVPATLYTNSTRFWPILDNAIRDAAISRHVTVKMLISWWKHSRSEMLPYLKSLMALNHLPEVSIEIQLFKVPELTSKVKIPYTRVNHNKYVVTDETAYIGTSNWSADYFLWTGGIGFLIQPPACSHDGASNTNTTSCSISGNQTVQSQLEAVFLRDWHSPFSHPVSNMSLPS